MAKAPTTLDDEIAESAADDQQGTPVAFAYDLTGLPPHVKQALGEQLDRDRVKRREGRGGGRFDFLETHDVIRAANSIFGYGKWGHRIVEQVEIAAVAVTSRNGKDGWHVGYRCVVELQIDGCQPMHGSGFGDGVEYGPASRVTACELALKESESDALKRAFKNFGDQFGLILYAKGDDQQRIERDQAADQAMQVRSDAPMMLEGILDRLNLYVEDAKPWVKEAAEAHFAPLGSAAAPFVFTGTRALPDEEKYDLLRRLQSVTVVLDSQEEFDPHAVEADKLQSVVRAAFAASFEGLAISGPDPFKPPIPF